MHGPSVWEGLLGIIGQDPSVSMSNWLHIDIIWFLFIKI